MSKENALKIVIIIVIGIAILFPSLISYMLPVIQCALPLTIFYISYRKNKNKIALVGFIFIMFYYFSLMLVWLFGDDYQVAITSLKYIINILEYGVIITMLFKDYGDSRNKIERIGLLLAIFLNQGIGIASICSETDGIETLNNMYNVTGTILVLVFCYVLYIQYQKELDDHNELSDDEVAKKIFEENKKIKEIYNGKKFYSPDLEEQERRYAEEKKARQKEKEQEK